jgi:hypothetical protein
MSAQAELYDKDGEKRLSLSIVADHVLALCQPNAALHVAAFAINALEFTKTQQKARVIGPVLADSLATFSYSRAKVGSFRALR